MKSLRPLFCIYLPIAIMFQACHFESMPELGFEAVDSTGINPTGWHLYGQTYDEGGYCMCLDSNKARTGKYALQLYQGTATYVLPAGYRGDSLELLAYLRTNSATASNSRGLWINTDDGDGELHAKYTENFDIINDGEWNPYSIKIPLHPYAREVVFGAYCYGDGITWVDDFEIRVDGKSVEKLRKREPMDYPALKDTVFMSSSEVPDFKPDEDQLEALELCARVWGFVKYYHPQVARGQVNMDSELFRLLPGIIEAEYPGETEKILSEWIRRLGSLPGCEDCPVEIDGDYKLLPDIGWISDGSLGEKLSGQLLEVVENRNTAPHYYLSLNPGIGNPVFKHEDPYADLVYPDAGYRLLALFRYWNMIQYFFPYKNLIGEDWKLVLGEYLPDFLSASDALEYRLITLHLIARIHDTHANIWGNDSILNDHFGRYYAPVQVRFIEDKAVVTGYYNKEPGSWSGLRPGDILLTVDGKKIGDILEDRLEYYPASNYPTKLRDIGRNLLRGSTGSVEVRYEREGMEQTAVLKRFPASELDRSADWSYHQPDRPSRFISESVGYINLGIIRTSLLNQIFDEFRDTRGIIIDIRNYPAEFVVFSLGKYLMPEPVEFVKFSQPVLSYPGLFEWVDPPAVGEVNPDYYKGKVVILVNELTQSQAEYTSMALRQAPRAMVLGSTTAAADGNVSRIFLPGNIFTMISGIGVYYPDGTETQRVGIVPDLAVQPSIAGIREGRDELLEKAIEIIENGDFLQ